MEVVKKESGIGWAYPCFFHAAANKGNLWSKLGPDKDFYFVTVGVSIGHFEVKCETNAYKMTI